MKQLLRTCAVALIALAALGPVALSAAGPTVAAASTLQFALERVNEAFARETGERVRLTFGSSGHFRRQIATGAPFELYLSADESYVEALHAEGHTVDEGAVYAVGRIGVITPRGHDSAIRDHSLEGLREAVEAGRLRRLAIANPEHAPYGVAARQALESAGLWEAVEPHLILGENVAQAARFALSGETDGGIIAYGLAVAPPLAERGTFALIPETAHAPLRQRMALIRGASPVARSFYRFLQGPEARDILAEYGFALPGPGD